MDGFSHGQLADRLHSIGKQGKANTVAVAGFGGSGESQRAGERQAEKRVEISDPAAQDTPSARSPMYTKSTVLLLAWVAM